MRTVATIPSLQYSFKPRAEPDEIALEFHRPLCLQIEVEDGAYESVEIVADRGEVVAEVYELEPACPSVQLWVEDRSVLILEVCHQDAIIAGGLWQVQIDQQRQDYALRCLCATEGLVLYKRKK